MNERATLVSKLRGYARLASRSVRPNWRVVFTMIGLSVAPVLNAAPGDLDSGGFAGGAGYTATAVNGFDGGARAMARQTDGKLVVAGRCVGSATGVDFCVARYEASGALDSTFGGTGLVLTNLSSGQDYATGIAIQSDGKMVVVGHCETSFASDFCLARYLLDGSLDVSFGGGGKVIAPVALDTTFATAVAIQSDGKILVAGQCLNVSDGDFCVVRYLSSGNLDSAGFGTGGVARTPTAVGAFDEAASLALQSDGKIVLAGGCNLPGRQFCVARLLGNGALDTSFGGTGIVSAAFSGTFNDALAVAIQSDGKIIVAGACTSGSTVSVICLARFQSNGAFDTGFGDGGKTELDVSPGQIDLGNAVALQADGKIVVAGRCRNDYFCVIRLLSDGRLDSTYDLDGVGENLPQFSYSEARAALIQPDGKLLVAGQCSEFSQLYFCLARYRIDGRLDKSLQDTGKAITPIGSGNDLMNASVVQPDGKIVSVGNCSWSNFSNFCVSRHLAHGVLDTSFIAAGVRLIAMGTASAVATAVALQSDGKIVVAGYCTNASTGEDFCLVRLMPSGVLDSSFGTSGQTTFSFSTGSDRPTALAIQPDGKILVVGTCPGALANGDFCMIRVNPNGESLDTSFGVDGLNAKAIGSGYDNPSAIALLPDGRFVVAGFCAVGADNQFCAARFNPDGSLDSSFDGDGRILHPIAGTFDDGWALALQPDGKVVIAGGCFVGGLSKFCAIRLNANGSLDTSFDGDGKVIVSFGAFSDAYARGVATQPDGKIVLGGSCSGAGYDFCVARLNDDGSLDQSFSGDGLQTAPVDPFTGNDNVTGLALQSDGKILLTGYCGSGVANDFCFARFQGDANGERSCSMDIDGDGVVLPTTDLLIATRVARGMVGSDVIRGLNFAVSATRTSWAEIRNFLVASCGMAVQP